MTSNSAEHNKTSLRLTAKQGSWKQIGDACHQVRYKVFVEEQQIAEEDEWDELDEVSEHFLLLINDRPVATARLTPDAKIGRFAVLKQLRGKNLGVKLMQRMLEHAKRQGIKKLALNAQTSVLDFYKKQGFSISGEEYLEVGIPHRPMQMSLAADLYEDTHLSQEDFLEALVQKNQVRVQGREQVTNLVECLLQQARRSICLEAPAYVSHWFSDASLSPLLSLAKRHQHSRVQFIFTDTLQFSRQSSNLLKLHQRAPTHIEIRKAATAYRPNKEAKLLIDDQHLLVWPNFQETRTELYTQEHREAYRQAQAFKLHWEKAETVKYLQGQTL